MRPHFIIIGAMKCATSTLHEQLDAQPGVFMSRPKEPNFFSDDDQYARGIDWYRGLFVAADPHERCGESSTHYTKRPTHPHTVERMSKHLDDEVRFIYVMRHPIDRLVSHYVHEWTMRSVDVSINEAVDALPSLVEYGRYAYQIEPYLARFGPERVLGVFFERLRQDPESELRRIALHIGLSPERGVRWDDSIEPQNVSAERLRASPMRDALINLPGVRFLRRAIVPRAWRDRVKRRWTMSERPTLSDQVRRRLKGIYDEDLARLEPWLGMRLTCDGFAEQVVNAVGLRRP